MSFRIGTGFDIHRLILGKKLILGGIHIPNDLGPDAHSDGDALTHALIDAMLGALALDDIGTHFPDTDEQYANISSILLLDKTRKLIHEHGYRINNVDATITLNEPKLRPHILGMRKSLAAQLKVNVDRVSIKATTTNSVPFFDQTPHVLAQAVCLLEADI